MGSNRRRVITCVRGCVCACVRGCVCACGVYLMLLLADNLGTYERQTRVINGSSRVVVVAEIVVVLF